MKKVNTTGQGECEVMVNNLIEKFIASVEMAKINIEPILYKWLKSLNCEIKERNILNIIERAIKSPSWRERSAIINLIIKGNGIKLNPFFLQIGAGVELVQEGFMLRDDILDEQRICVRRNTIFNLFGGKVTNLAADILFSGARQLFLDGLAGINLSNDKMTKCIRLFEEMIYLDIVGQWADLESERLSYEEGLEKRYFMMIHYTPGTQFKNIAAIAYLISNNLNKDSLRNIQNWGLNFGMAAQLRDDIIDIIGHEEVVHKKLGTDVLRRKKRLPLIKFLEMNPKYKKYFNYKKYPQLPEEKTQEILGEMRQNKSNDYCIKMVKKIINKAINYLKKGDINKKEKEILLAITNLLGIFED